jgi:mannose-6-phosphate isomerase-like protein (cupin superfamily)
VEVEMKNDEVESNASGVYCHGREDEEPLRFIGDLFTIKARSSHTSGAYSLMEMIVSPHAAGPPVHHHTDCEEAFYVISGELSFRVDDAEVDARAGTFIVVRRGARHTYTNPGDEPARVLVLISPPGFEQHFIDMGEPTGGE